MENIRNIVEGMKHCANSMLECKGCPYNGKGRALDRTWYSCRQALLIDAAEMLRNAEIVVDESIKIEMEKPTSVGFKETEAVEAMKEAQYWRGYAAALQWAFSDRFESMAEEEPNNV